MKDLRLYQIYYNEETRRQLDPGFIPLDNTANERPDWFEYWPIRSLFLEHDFSEETWIGVFSPKFFKKTGLSSHEVREATLSSNADVVSFSPWLGHIAVYWNIFDQIEYHHPGAMLLIDKLIDKKGFNKNMIRMPMTTKKTIFCNYFVAPLKVWKMWFDCFDVIFDLSEKRSCEYGLQLNYGSKNIKYNGVPLKIFVCEALISIVAMQNNFFVDYRAKSDKIQLGMGFSDNIESFEILKSIDMIKESIGENPSLESVAEYKEIVQEVLSLRHYIGA